MTWRPSGPMHVGVSPAGWQVLQVSLRAGVPQQSGTLASSQGIAARASLQQLVPSPSLPAKGKMLLAPWPAFQWDVGSNGAQQLGTMGKWAKTQRSCPGAGAECFESITATWALLALKAFKLHLKALKTLLSPCLIALKAFKPLLQDGKPTEAKPLALASRASGDTAALPGWQR